MSTPELQQIEAAGAVLLHSMIIGSLTNNQMPPPQMFTWSCDYALESLRYAELQNVEPELRLGLAEQIKFFMHILETNKQLGLLQKMKDALKARILRLPPDFDATYGGLLSWV
jgi:hypothetical protein